MVSQIKLGDIAVDVVLKDIKNVHLSVYPPTGRVRISAPKRMKMETIRVFAISKLDWIKQQKNKLRDQDLFKQPGVTETLDWANALTQLNVVTLTPDVINDTLGSILKYQDDIAKIRGSEAARLLAEIQAAA